MKLRPYKYVLWDWNGTIIDDVSLCYEIFLEQARRFNLHHMDLDTYRFHFGFPVEEFYTFAGFTGTTEEYGELAKLFIEKYNARRMECEVQKGVHALLQNLQSHGVVSYILSAYEHNSLNEMVKACKMDHYFSSVSGLEGVHAGSKLEAGRLLCKDMSIQVEEALYLGDTVHDYEVGNALGMDVLLVTNGHNAKERLQRDCPQNILLDSLEVVEL